MPEPILSSQVSSQEEQPQIPQIVGVAQNRCGLVGITERGPVGEAVLSTSFDEWARVFGGDNANSDAVHAARGFFENGGQELYTVRTTHYADIAVAGSKTSAKATKTLLTPALLATAGTVLSSIAGPYNLEPADTLIIAVDGGGDQPVTFDAAAAARESTGAEPFALANNDVLTVSIDGGANQLITFLTAEFANIAAATAEEVAAVINAKLVGAGATVTSGGTKVTITSDRKGTGSGVNVVAGGAQAVGKLNITAGNVAGTGDVANIDAVTATEVANLINADTAGCVAIVEGGAVRITSDTTGGASSVQVKVASTADDEIGFDNASHPGVAAGAQNTITVSGKYDGAYGNDLTFKVADATDGVAAHFNLSVLDGGLIVETFANLDMDSASARYIETIVNHADNGSALISVADLETAGLDKTTRRPANGTSSAATGGSDGLSGLADADFTGNAGAQTGVHALDVIQDLRLLVIPGRATSSVHSKMISYCETSRLGSCYALLDPPAGLTAAQMVAYVETTAVLLGLSEFGHIHWPRGKVVNPNKTVYGSAEQLVVPVSGHIAGACARVDNAKLGGVHEAVAGVVNGQLFGVVDVETKEALDRNKMDLVEPKNINTLTSLPGIRPFLNNSNCLKTTGNWGTIGERRGMIFIEQAIKRAMEFVRQRNLVERLYAEVKSSVDEFLRQQAENDAFASRNPKLAFFCDAGPGLNTAAVKKAKTLKVRIGVAKAKPAQFVLLLFSETTRAIDNAI